MIQNGHVTKTKLWTPDPVNHMDVGFSCCWDFLHWCCLKAINALSYSHLINPLQRTPSNILRVFLKFSWNYVTISSSCKLSKAHCPWYFKWLTEKPRFGLCLSFFLKRRAGSTTILNCTPGAKSTWNYSPDNWSFCSLWPLGLHYFMFSLNIF